MASPETLDFERVLAPIPGENPAGIVLREDLSPDSPYYAIKDARSAARAAERNQLWDDEPGSGTEAPNWKTVLKLGPQILAEKSKDLEVAGWLVEGMIRRDGYAGLRDGFRLLRGLVEDFWEGLHPLPDEDGLLTRIAPITGLNGEESDGVLIWPMMNVPVTLEGSYRQMTVSDYVQALDLEGVDDAQKRQQRIDQGAASLQMIKTAIAETPDDYLRNLLEDLDQCAEQFDALTAVLEEKCGEDESGYPLAPPSSTIRNTLATCRDHLRSLTKELFAEEAEAESPEPAAEAATATAGASPKRIETREQAFQSLLQIAEFFKRTEPHSPISYALEQAVRWGKMPLPELLSELIPDYSSREQLFKLVGIQLPEGEE